ncbi:hypothetical protein SARC_11227 [Sphaeroforma arctica JP610]|uniref:Uncharacterized protein n=1 Tax=Sphaeroforma arctica JP610 TaxID=667725 RepID=A0A0L0FHL0_9EUKA|nr:hypothetical protein SARC_11227 [Sphaeroforma arctica JP610]KNC76264.1 hypothetical protein SARC_11227 [Sphaeroforma arctica JP610]|eukprot:XP_014150166.1 hypothetical protein SARC_11227 [Sphaeroforma arctica JP610]
MLHNRLLLTGFPLVAVVRQGITEATEDMVQQLVDMIDAALAKIQTGTEVLHRDVLSISKELVDGSKRSGQQQVEMMTHLQTVLGV